MNNSEKKERKIQIPLNKEAKVTTLTLLKNFYDEQIFNILIKYFYDSNIDISISAINSSGSLGNEIAIPHLYRIVEHGKQTQKIEAIRTLSEIKAPSSIEYLAKYFNIFPSLEVRKEILQAINKISPFHPHVRELNKSILVSPKKEFELFEIVIKGLLESGVIELIKNHVPNTPPEIQRIAFTKILESSGQETSSFISSFQETIEQFDPHTLGCYLCAYELKTGKPKSNFIIDMLKKSELRTTTSFIMTLSNYNGRIQFPTRLFRLLLRTPYVDQETEILNGDFLIKIVDEVKAHSPLIMNEFIFTTATHLEAVFSKLKKQYISLKGIKEKDTLLIVILAKIMERYATPELLRDTQDYFKNKTRGNPDTLIRNIKEQLLSGSKDDQHRFNACVPLFMDYDSKVRLNISQTLSKINLTSYSLLRRLNRLVRVIGTLEIKNSGKKILEILRFAREERIQFLEETCVVTLCQLMNRSAVEQARTIFTEPAKHISSVNGYIRGARYIPPKILINPLIKLLLNPDLNSQSRELIVDSLSNMNLSTVKGIMPPLIRALKLTEIDNSLKLDISDILSKYGDSILFQPILDLTGSEEPFTRQIGIHTLGNLARKEKNIPIDVLTNRLYLMLEDTSNNVRIESLVALLSLDDDYAIQILEDYVNSDDKDSILELLNNVGKFLSHQILSIVLKLLKSKEISLQQELRRILPQFCRGDLAEEIRKTLLDSLKEQQESSTVVDKKSLKDVLKGQTGLIEHAKMEFKFRRENSQELTVFFIDIVSYTQKSAQADTSDLIKLIRAFEEISLPSIANLKGTLIKKLGDGLLAVFKHPLNAAIAALTIQNKIKEYNQYKMDSEKFNVRIGLNTGLVIRKDNDVYGDTVNVASRMETSASPGDILLTQNTYDEIKEYIRCTRLGDIQLKGKDETITAFTAEKITVNIDHILSGDKEKPVESQGTGETQSLTTLKESVFNPEFHIPENLSVDEDIARGLESIFVDMTKAVEDITQDYHDEYIFKRYLQDKWNDMIALYQKAPVQSDINVPTT